MYLENVLPQDLYERMLARFPDPTLYSPAAMRHYAAGEARYTRSMFALTPDNLALLSVEQQQLWRGVAAAATVAPRVRVRRPAPSRSAARKARWS